MARGTRKSLRKSLPTLKRNHHGRKLKRSITRSHTITRSHKLMHKGHKILPFKEFMKKVEREKIIRRLSTIHSELRMYRPNSNEYKELIGEKSALSERFASLQNQYNIVQGLSQEEF